MNKNLAIRVDGRLVVMLGADVAALRIQSSPQFFRLVPRFLPAGESQKLTGQRPVRTC